MIIYLYNLFGHDGPEICCLALISAPRESCNHLTSYRLKNYSKSYQRPFSELLGMTRSGGIRDSTQRSPSFHASVTMIGFL
jgi:hypothetical protein